MDVVAFLTGEELGTRYKGGSYAPEGTWVSDIWGWVDPVFGREYALVGMWDGVSIVDITTPNEPRPVVFVETPNPLDQSYHNLWRDIKVVA
mmetsp:Transcript_14895/g.22670  ORF Transcript_14895/g.22670 Transcript_14895/m.22670 type:complete len:91 (+) Transcript_14895:89-361(+)